MAESVVFINANGDSIELKQSKPYFLQYITGTGGAETDIQTQKSAFQDGSSYLDTVLQDRNIDFEVMLLADNNEELFQMRKTLNSIFNPKLGNGELIYSAGETVIKRLVCTVSLAPVFVLKDKGPTTQKVMFSLLATNPFWTDNFVTGEILTQSVPQFSFPLELTDAFEFETRGTNRTTINNEGDVETPVKIIFNGPATNPIVLNETTGEYIKVTKTLLDGESLIINTALGEKSVIFDAGNSQSNAFGNIDLASTFFNLKIGENEVSYSADAGINTASVTISYRQRYAGV